LLRWAGSGCATRDTAELHQTQPRAAVLHKNTWGTAIGSVPASVRSFVRFGERRDHLGAHNKSLWGVATEPKRVTRNQG
jgi:hypothetical protein